VPGNIAVTAAPQGTGRWDLRLMIWLRWCGVITGGTKLVALFPVAYIFANITWVETFQSWHLYSLHMMIVREMHLICASATVILLRCPGASVS